MGTRDNVFVEYESVIREPVVEVQRLCAFLDAAVMFTVAAAT